MNESRYDDVLTLTLPFPLLERSLLEDPATDDTDWWSLLDECDVLAVEDIANK